MSLQLKLQSRTHSLLSLRDPKRVAFVEGATGRTMTWGDITPVDAPSPLGLLIDDPLEMARWFIGGLAAGITVVPLSPRATEPELAASIASLGLAAVATDLGTGRVEVRRMRGARPSASQAGLILSSSGTTGAPKAIALSEDQLLRTAASIVEHHGIGWSDRGYSPLPLSHINGLVVGVLSTLWAESSMVLDRRISASTFWDTVISQEVTWLNLVPALLTILANRPGPDRQSVAAVRFARSASAPLPVAILRRWEDQCGIGVLETYGMTEAASQITANPIDAVARRAGSVGLPVDIDLCVVDADGRESPPGDVGHVMIRGPRAAASSWLPTGDLGRRDEDGYLYLVARVDDVINRGGEKVYPAEVESVLLADRDVTTAVVVGRAHPVVGEEPVAYILTTLAASRHAELAARLDRRCVASLSPYKRPAHVEVVETLPTGPTGKVRRVDVKRAQVEVMS